MMQVWAAGASASETRDIGRARFQIDAPVTAGRAFFEMTAFMLHELVTVRREAYEGGAPNSAAWPR